MAPGRFPHSTFTQRPVWLHQVWARARLPSTISTWAVRHNQTAVLLIWWVWRCTGIHICLCKAQKNMLSRLSCDISRADLDNNNHHLNDFTVPPTEPQLAEFPSYYKSSYAWDHVPTTYDFRQMGFPPSLLQHASSLYGAHLKQSSETPQPLDCSTHYSPTSNTYHCITCDKVRSLFIYCLFVMYIFILVFFLGFF